MHVLVCLSAASTITLESSNMKGVLYNLQYSVLLELTRNWLSSKSRGTMLPHVEHALSTKFCLVTFRNVSRPFSHRHSYIQNKLIHIHSKYGSVTNKSKILPKEWKKYILVGLSSRTSGHSKTSSALYACTRMTCVDD